MNEENKDMYVIEIGRERANRSSFFAPPVKLIYVIATSYNNAAKKAMVYIEAAEQNTAPVTFNKEGDLNLKEDEGDLKIKSISLFSDELIW